ncbi:hypothetical protein [Streptacidiphilus sp. PAMC 29251]
MQTGESETKKDLRAAVLTAQELGPDYENEILDGFLQRLDQRIDAQIAVRVRRELGVNPVEQRQQQQRGGRSANAFQYLSLVLAVPLSAIGASLGHLPGLVIAWGGIVGLNFVQLRSQRQEQRSERRGDDWD